MSVVKFGLGYLAWLVDVIWNEIIKGTFVYSWRIYAGLASRLLGAVTR